MRESFFPDYCNSLRFSFVLKFLFLVRAAFSFVSGRESCLSCGRKTSSALCDVCSKSFQSVRFSGRCRICGKNLISEIDVCSACREHPVLKSCDGVFPLLSYRLWRKTLLFAWKIEEKRSLSPFFAHALFLAIRSLESELSLSIPVVPVPPRPGKIRDKGWDQIDEVCHYLRIYWNVRILKFLRRLSKLQQKKLDRVQRLEGASSSYAIADSRLSISKSAVPEAVILLDDVITTGSTVEGCSALLKKMGIKKVYVLSLFVVD